MKLKPVLFFCAPLALLFLSGVIGYSLTDSKVSAQNRGESTIDQPIDLNSPGFFKAPKEPRLKNNKNLSTDKFISKERAIGKISAKAKLINSDLKGWKDFKKNNIDQVTVSDIDPDRMVWEVNFQFPEGVEVEGDKYYDAAVTKVVDAETEELVYFKVSTPADKLVRGSRPGFKK